MRSAIFAGAGKPIAIENIPDPTPGRDQVVVKVGLCGICGTDLHMADADEETRMFLPPPGAIIGHEFCGEVVALGPGVERLAIGDRIAAMPVSGCGACVACLAGHPAGCASMYPMFGGFGEYAVASATFATRLPAGLSSVDGALVEPLATALRAVRRSGMSPGARVLVLGAGAIGLATVFWARRLGAGKIVATARSRWRETLALDMGANAFVTSDGDLAADAERILGGPPDIVFEASGAQGMVATALQLVRPRGTIVVEGGCTLSDSFIPFIGMIKEVSMIFSVAHTVDDFRFVVDTLDAGALEPRKLVTETRSLDAMPETLATLRGSAHQCKVMIDPWLAHGA